MTVFARSAVALVCLGVAGLAAGCGAPPETETKVQVQGDQAFVFPVLPPFLMFKTSAPVPDGATCGSIVVPQPTSLADFDCTLGVEVLSDPDLVRTWIPGDPLFPGVTAPTGEEVQAYAWACQAVSTSGVSIDTALQEISDAQVSFGGPAVISRFGSDVWNATYVNSCFGTPDAGYVLVLETFRDIEGTPRPHGCDDDQCSDPSDPTSGDPPINVPILKI